MFVEFMKEEIIKSVKLNSLCPPFLLANKGGHAHRSWDNGVIIGHSARPAASGHFHPRSQPTASGIIQAGSKDPRSCVFLLPPLSSGLIVSPEPPPRRPCLPH